MMRGKTEGTGRRLEARWDEGGENEVWDAFVEGHPLGHPEQTARWGRVRTLTGWRVLRILAWAGEELVGGVQAMIRPMRGMGACLYVTYGPLATGDDGEVIRLLLGEVQRCAAARGAGMVVLGLPYGGDGMIPEVLAAGFRRKPTWMPPMFLDATGILDLRRGEEELLKRARSSVRRNIRLAERKGVEVVEGTEADLPVFFERMSQLCRRLKTPPNPGSLLFFEALWREYRPRGWIRLFLAKQGGEVISAGIATVFRGWFRLWKVGWNGERGEIKPNDALKWGMVRAALRGGCQIFEDVHLDREVAEAILAGKSWEEAASGRSEFKLGIGLEPRLLPGAFLYFGNPLMRGAHRLGLLEFGMKWMMRALEMRRGLRRGARRGTSGADGEAGE